MLVRHDKCAKHMKTNKMPNAYENRMPSAIETFKLDWVGALASADLVDTDQRDPLAYVCVPCLLQLHAWAQLLDEPERVKNLLRLARAWFKNRYRA